MNSDAFNRRKEVTTLESQADLLPGLNTNRFQHLAQCNPKGLPGFLPRKQVAVGCRSLPEE